MQNYFNQPDLLETPTKRAAFSDRTAYLMAEMSRLAYFKFEGGHTLSEIKEELAKLLPSHNRLPAILALIQSHLNVVSADESKSVLAEILKQNGFTLVETFSNNSTGAQAFLCTQLQQNIAILAFRGTELNRKDIKTDVKARLSIVNSDGDDIPHTERAGDTVLIHSGYLEQFNSIRSEVEQCLNRSELKNLQLFITGHSLGGALAIVATKFLANDISGACYTFGSPPVGTKEFDNDIKTPIYRIVNHVDIVPRLPSPTLVLLMRLLAMIIGLLLGPFTTFWSGIKESKWYGSLSRFILDAQKYRQSGYSSFLVGNGTNVRLRYSVGPYDRVVWWIKAIPKNFQGEFKMLSDHSIETYSEKLAKWANKRQTM